MVENIEQYTSLIRKASTHSRDPLTNIAITSHGHQFDARSISALPPSSTYTYLFANILTIIEAQLTLVLLRSIKKSKLIQGEMPEH